MNATFSFRDLVSFDRPKPPSNLSLIQTLKSAASATTGALSWKKRALDAIKGEKSSAKLPPSNHTFRQYKLSLRSGWDASSVCAADYNFTDAFYPQFVSTLSLCGIDVLAATEDSDNPHKTWATTIGLLSFMVDFLNNPSREAVFFYTQEKATLKKSAQNIVDEMLSDDTVDVAYPYASFSNIFPGVSPKIEKDLSWLTNKDGTSIGTCKFENVPDQANFGAVAVLMRRHVVVNVLERALQGGIRAKSDDSNMMSLFRQMNVNVALAYPKEIQKWQGTSSKIVASTDYVLYNYAAKSLTHAQAFVDVC